VFHRKIKKIYFAERACDGVCVHAGGEMTVISTFTTIAFSTLRSPHRTHTKINPLGTCPLFIAAMNSLWPRNCPRADVIRICFFCLRLSAPISLSLSRVLRARRVQIISLLRPVITAMRVCVFMCVRSRPKARKMNLVRGGGGPQ
jgi:hypothetical protein